MFDCIIITTQGDSEEGGILSTLRSAVTMAGMRQITLELSGSMNPPDARWERLRSAKVVLADISSLDVATAFDLGFRYGMQMPIVMVSDINTTSSMLGDHEVYYLQHDGTDESAIASRLRKPLRKSQRHVFSRWRHRTIAANIRDGLDENYYDALILQLQNCRSKVFQIGDGIPTKSRMATIYARVLAGCAIQNSVIRIELAGPQHQKWWRLVAKHLMPISGFSLFVPTTKHDLPDWEISVVDWDDRRRATALISAPTGTRSEETCSHGHNLDQFSFWAQSPAFAGGLYQLMKNFLDSGLVEEMKSVDQLANHLAYEDDWVASSGAGTHEGASVYYFAYGCNMNPRHLKSRVADSVIRVIGHAWLSDYRLSFTIPGSIFSGAAANITPSKGSTVHGVLYEINEDELDRLDFYEGVQDGEYERRLLPVTGETLERPQNAWIYSSVKDFAYSASPSSAYMTAIIDGATHHQLPSEYVESLRNISVEDRDQG